MFDRLPNRLEVGTLAVMALICAAVVVLVPKHDYAMMFASMPLFAVSAMLGFRRSEQRKVRPTQAAKPDEKLVP